MARLGARAAVVGAALLGTLLAGCTATPAPTDVSTSSVTQTSQPAKYGKQVAAKAAEITYRRYTAIALKLARDPRIADVDKLSALVTPTQLKAEQANFARAKSEGIHIRGPVDVKVFRLQRFNSRTGELKAYVCTDFSDRRVLDSAGKDVTPSNSVGTITSIANFVPEGDRWLFAGQRDYEGAPLC